MLSFLRRLFESQDVRQARLARELEEARKASKRERQRLLEMAQQHAKANRISSAASEIFTDQLQKMTRSRMVCMTENECDMQLYLKVMTLEAQLADHVSWNGHESNRFLHYVFLLLAKALDEIRYPGNVSPEEKLNIVAEAVRHLAKYPRCAFESYSSSMGWKYPDRLSSYLTSSSGWRDAAFGEAVLSTFEEYWLVIDHVKARSPLAWRMPDGRTIREHLQQRGDWWK